MTAISKSQKIPWGPRTIEMFSVGDTFRHHHVTSQSQLIAGFQPYEQFICTMIKTKTTEGTMGCELSSLIINMQIVKTIDQQKLIKNHYSMIIDC